MYNNNRPSVGVMGTRQSRVAVPTFNRLQTSLALAKVKSTSISTCQFFGLFL